MIGLHFHDCVFIKLIFWHWWLFVIMDLEARENIGKPLLVVFFPLCRVCLTHHRSLLLMVVSFASTVGIEQALVFINCWPSECLMTPLSVLYWMTERTCRFVWLTSLLSELLTNFCHSNDGENQFLKLIRKRKDLMLINYLVTILLNWYALYLIHSCWQF